MLVITWFLNLVVELAAEDQRNHQQAQAEQETGLDPEVGGRVVDDPVDDPDDRDDQGRPKRGRDLAEGVERGHRIGDDLVGQERQGLGLQGNQHRNQTELADGLEDGDDQDRAVGADHRLAKGPNDVDDQAGANQDPDRVDVVKAAASGRQEPGQAGARQDCHRRDDCALAEDDLNQQGDQDGVPVHRRRDQHVDGGGEDELLVMKDRQVDQLVVTAPLGEVEEDQKGDPDQDVAGDVEGGQVVVGDVR